MSTQQKQLPVRKNDILTITATSMNSDGQGVGHVDRYAVFIPGLLPGETAEVQIIKTGSAYGVAKVLELTVPSPDRVDPFCPVFPACGGCTLQHLSYPAQLKYKTQMVKDCLQRIGGFRDVSVCPAIGMDDPLRYRNKGSFPLGEADGRTVFGFFSPRTHRLIPISDCPIQDSRVISVMHKIQQWAETYRVSVYCEETKKGILRHAVLRVTSEHEIIAVLVTTGPFPHESELVEALPDVSSIWHNVNPSDTNVIFGKTFRFLHGKEHLYHQIDGLRYSIHPQSFLQVNTVQTALLYRTAIRFLNPGRQEKIIDAYCGAGTISLLLAGECGSVLGIESVPAAVDDAKRNADINRISNAAFVCGEVENVLPGICHNYDALIIDPPRKGCDPKVLHAIGQSSLNRMVYISCNPSTLARDMQILSTYGFSPVEIQPVDMFPFTSHVETVVCLRRENVDG